jgi:hypothetical protein
MDKDALLTQWQKEEKAGISGWDFSRLAGRWYNDPLPWHYKKIVRDHLRRNDHLLDMGTGGGELLRSFHHDPALTSVTEAWEPNVKLLEGTLAQRGVAVYAVPKDEPAQLPVPDASQDIILNSHAAFDAELVFSKLKPGGLFITEQVGATNNFALSRFLVPDYTPAFPDNTMLHTVADFDHAGMEIIQADTAHPTMTFFDVGAVVYYASIIPWEFPGFSVAQAKDQLFVLQGLIETHRRIVTKEDRFLVMARKPSR